jgi:hypothetical protein
MLDSQEAERGKNKKKLDDFNSQQASLAQKLVEYEAEIAGNEKKLATMDEKIKQQTKIRKDRDFLVLNTMTEVNLEVSSIDLDDYGNKSPLFMHRALHVHFRLLQIHRNHVDMDAPNGSFEGPSLQKNQLDEFEYNFDNLIKEHTDKVGALEADHKRAEDKLSSEVSKSQAKVDLLDQSIGAKEKQVLVHFWSTVSLSLVFDRIFLGFTIQKRLAR